MDFFEKIGDTLTQFGKDVSQKATELSGIAKLKFDIRAKEDFIKEQYIVLGKAYYKKHRGGQDEEQARFDQIDEALDAIAKMKLQISELKRTRICPKCGNETPDVAEYCSYCGAKLSDIVDDSPYEETDV